MKTISIYEAKTNFSKIVDKARKGEPTYIGAFGKPEVMIVPIPQSTTVSFGLLKGKLKYNSKDFIGINKEVQKMFYGDE